jgi:hypothetical protein
MKSLYSKSSLISLLFNGRFSHILTPWHLELNIEEMYIKISKRNWYLIGVDTNLYAFRFIRNIKIDTHIFGADVEIKITGGVASALSIPKSDVRKIKEIIIQYNNTKKGKHLIFH